MIRDFIRRKLKEALGSPAPTTPPPPPPPRARAPAPVMLYVEWDSPDLDAVVALLTAAGIPYKRLDVDHDEATKTFLENVARRPPPVLFIATDVIGWLDELKALEASGELARRVFGGPVAKPT